MAILRVETPEWARIEMEKQQGVPQQRTIIPRSVFTQGINGPQRPTMPGSQDKQRQLDQKMSTKQDAVPAMLRQGEEVIPPEIVNHMGGREEFLKTLNDKLNPTGIQLHGGNGPVSGGQAENDTMQGTVRPTNERGGFACGTTGIRMGYAKGGQAQVPTGPTSYPGGMLTNYREGAPNSIDYGPRQKQQMGTMRIGFADGTTPVLPKPIVAPPAQQQAAPVVTTPSTPTKTQTASAPTIVAPPSQVNTVTQPDAGSPQAANISPATKGIGFNVQDVTQSPYYKSQAKATDEAIQKQGAVGQMQNAQNLAQAGIGQETAAGRTSNAQQQAATESNIAKANTQLAQGAQQQEQSDLQNAMNLAYNSGDWGSVNKILAATGQAPIDFTNLEQQRQSGNLSGAAQTLFNLANSITGTDAQSIATKSALSQEATGLLSTSLKTTLGAQYNPETLNKAVSDVASGDISDPATKTFVDHVASAPLQWIQNTQTGQLFAQMFENNPAGKALLAKANAGDPTSISLCAELATYAASNDYGVQLNDTQIALMKQYGVYMDLSTLNAMRTATQEKDINSYDVKAA